MTNGQSVAACRLKNFRKERVIVEKSERHAFERVADDDGQYHCGDDGVEPVALRDEIEQGKGYAHDGREDKDKNARLYPPGGGEMGQSRHDASEGGVFRRVAFGFGIVERAVKIPIERFAPMIDEVEHSAYEGYDAGQRYADAQGGGGESLYVVFHFKWA